MAKVTVTSLSGLASFSNQLEHLSSLYRDAVGKAGRDLNAKAKEDDNQGEAIVAYLEKVNALQSQIFEKYPGDIAYFSQIVKMYMSSLKGMGFQQKAWSWHLGADDVKKALQTDQVDVVTTYIDQFQSAFDIATDALNEDRIDLSSVQEMAETSFMEYGKQRKELDNKVSKAYLDFVSLLRDINNRFASIQPIIQTCLHLETLPIGSVIGAIKAGRMTKDDMSMLEAIQQKGDGAMIEALISGDPYTNLGNVNPEQVSDATMALVYNKIYEGTFGTDKKDGDISMLEDFLVAMTKQDKNVVKNYMKKLLFASDKNALILRKEGVDLLPEFKKENIKYEDMKMYLKQLEERQPEFFRIDDKLEKAGQLASLFESIYGNELGHQYRKHRVGTHYSPEISNSFVKGSLKRNNQGFVYSFEENGYNPATHEIVARYHRSSNGVETGKKLSEINSLQSERKQAITTFISDLGKTTATFISPYSTGAMVALNVIFDFVGKDQSKVNNNIDTLSSFRYLTNDPVKSNIGAGAGLSSSIVKFFNSTKDMDDKLSKAKEDAKNFIFNVGGTSYTKSKEMQSSQYKSEYDLQFALTIEDMNKNGLKAHVFRQTYQDTKDITLGIEEIDRFANDVKNNQGFSNKDVKNYFLNDSYIEFSDLDLGKDLYDGYLVIGDDNLIHDFSKSQPSSIQNDNLDTTSILSNQSNIFDKIIKGKYIIE